MYFFCGGPCDNFLACTPQLEDFLARVPSRGLSRVRDTLTVSRFFGHELFRESFRRLDFRSSVNRIVEVFEELGDGETLLWCEVGKNGNSPHVVKWRRAVLV